MPTEFINVTQDGRTIIPVKDATWMGSFGVEVADGNVPGYTRINKTGWNDSVGSATYEPINEASAYPTPSVLTSLEILSSSVNDAAGGSGAQSVGIQGVGTGWADEGELVELNGTTPVPLANQYYRIDELFCQAVGTYQSTTALPNDGVITLREAGGGPTWAQIKVIDGLGGAGAEQVGAYTIRAGQVGFLNSVFISIDTNQSASLILMVRSGADVVGPSFVASRSTPFEGMVGTSLFKPVTPVGAITGPSDLIFMVRADQGSASVTINIEIIVKDRD